MNVLVIGLGSMGKRRIRLIGEVFPDSRIYGVDTRADRCDEVLNHFGVESVTSIEKAANRFSIDAAFVCTSPLSHSRIISTCLHQHWNVFTELNLVEDGYIENMKLAKENGCVLFLSSTFLYRDEIHYIRKKVDVDCSWNYIYHVGQYLPDWHPWEKYHDFFISHKRTNGCREIMAIEFPWICKIFGDVEKIQRISDKMTGLQVDYQDNYMIQIMHKNGNKGMVLVDVVSPVAVRRLEVYAEHRYLRWDGTPDTLMEYDEKNRCLQKVAFHEKEEHEEGYQAFVVENAYRNEVKEFFDVVAGGKQQIYGFKEDLATLRLIDQVEAQH